MGCKWDAESYSEMGCKWVKMHRMGVHVNIPFRLSLICKWDVTYTPLTSHFCTEYTAIDLILHWPLN